MSPSLVFLFLTDDRLLHYFAPEFSHPNADAPPIGLTPLGFGAAAFAAAVSLVSLPLSRPRAIPLALSPDNERRACGTPEPVDSPASAPPLRLPSSKNRDCPPPPGLAGNGDAVPLPVPRDIVRAGLSTLMPWSRFGRDREPPLPLRIDDVSEVEAPVPSRRQLPHVASEEGVRDVKGVVAEGGLSSLVESRGGSEVVVIGSKVTRSCFCGCCEGCGTGVASMSRMGTARGGAVCGLELSMCLCG